MSYFTKPHENQLTGFTYWRVGQVYLSTKIFDYCYSYFALYPNYFFRCTKIINLR